VGSDDVLSSLSLRIARSVEVSAGHLFIRTVEVRDAFVITIQEALARVLAEARPLEPEVRPLTDALGSVVVHDVVAPFDVPPFDNSAMDGFAIRSFDTVEASVAAPVRLELKETIPAGTAAIRAIASGETAKIMTGAPLPPGADAVIQWENTEPVDDGVLIAEPVVPGTNVRRAGEDMARGAVVLERGHLLSPPEIGLLATLGCPEIEVHRRPRVAIYTIPTATHSRRNVVSSASSLIVWASLRTTTKRHARCSSAD
jgi:molybdopterin molybdotransferase